MSVDDQAEVSRLQHNLDAVRERIRAAGGDPERIRLVAVTKAFGPEMVRAALAAGLRDLGENYAQELVAKHDALRADPPAALPTWHFLGRLQTNKVRLIASIVGMWQSVDRASLVGEIARRAPGAPVLIQINASGEDQKGGCTFDEAPALVEQAATLGLDVQGLMAVGTAADAAGTRAGFARVVALADKMGLHERSIGMSGDLEIAVGEGATMIRIGRDLFGDRPVRAVS